jgi:hypothetical protein
MKRLSSNTLIFFLTLLFYQCIDTSSNRKNILNINEKLLSEKSYTFQNFTFNTPKGWVLMNHTVGEGAKGNTEVVQRQWYVLWGLAPLNDVDTNSMAGGAEDYNIEVKQSFVDAIIGAFTGAVTIAPRTVTVTK